MKHIPNALTLLRLVLAPVVAWLMWESAQIPVRLSDLSDNARAAADLMTAAAIVFVIAALTDLFDGMIARAFNYHSKFGRIIDPIADKALVGLPLLTIAIFYAGGLPGPESLIVMVSAAVIILRDIGMTVYRLMAPDGEGVRVSSLAKWKTTLELVVLGSFLFVAAMQRHLIANGSLGGWTPYAETFRLIWLGLLLITAVLSAWTAFQYLRPVKPAP
jgi:CDP-diacylglycerol--glycerol-3-phosphate 3-phosphatidyltransferase